MASKPQKYRIKTDRMKKAEKPAKTDKLSKKDKSK